MNSHSPSFARFSRAAVVKSFAVIAACAAAVLISSCAAPADTTAAFPVGSPSQASSAAQAAPVDLTPSIESTAMAAPVEVAVADATPVAEPAPEPAPVAEQAPKADPAPKAEPQRAQQEAPAPAPAQQPVDDGYGCDAAMAYLRAHAHPAFQLVCGGYAFGGQAVTCLNHAPQCANQAIIIINVPCKVAYMNEAANSWTLYTNSGAKIDPYGATC